MTPSTVPAPGVEDVAARPDRAGRRQIAGHFSEDAARQFKVLAAQRGMTTQALLAEALNDLFEKNGLRPIA